MQQLALELGGVTILRKGEVDVISNGNMLFVSSVRGSPKRAGGQGDILAGLTGTFYAWARNKERKDAASSSSSSSSSFSSSFSPSPSSSAPSAAVLACVAGSYATRLAATEAFALFKRGTMASHVLDQVRHTMEKLFSSAGAKL